ncbi:PTS glucose transporter subunit IIA [Nanchangia anserum]|uniref:PTS glucose transporter subunit IIA n=2 Tax=Nanchangia anserum TaxID=2692125 RepID=A0A8I0KPQ6_9ACTO|nr:PTS glucose transporter subunit IIA [Nanchangia anserum]QOX82632.1 PTS glucose transporter subunit IIA [Nanchangia anserum]
MATDFAAIAPRLVDLVGGAANVEALSHCATRLRFVLRDNSRADADAIKALPGVITVMKAGGQVQVVIGNDVSELYEQVKPLLTQTPAEAQQASGERGNLLDRFISLISALINPLIWPFAGAGLLKAFVTLGTTYLGLDTESSTYVILNAAGDAIFYFLPIFLALTAARRFGANEITSMALGAALVYPTIVALAESPDPVTFFGIPVVMATYTSSVIPIVITVWIQKYLEKGLRRILPSAIRNFTTPLLVMTIMVPLILMTVGPVTQGISSALATGVNWLLSSVPWLAGALLGAFWQVFVIFGVHWGLVPLALTEISEMGYSTMMAPLAPAVLAQGAAIVAVAIRTKSPERRRVAGPAALSALLAGITEPGIYGVNLPLKRPFVCGCIGGAIGGAMAAMAGAAASAFVVPSAIAIPAYISHGSVPLFLAGIGVAIVVSFALTLLVGFREEEPARDENAVGAAEEAPAPVEAAGVVEVTTEIASPATGHIVALSDVNDRVFASGAMGQGVGVASPSGPVLAPVSGTIVTAMDTAHAYGIKTDDNVEVLVHIGVDTVKLGGEGFVARVATKQRVQAGDVLADVDWATLEKGGYDPTVITIVMNAKKLTTVTPRSAGDVDAGQSIIDIEK